MTEKEYLEKISSENSTIVQLSKTDGWKVLREKLLDQISNIQTQIFKSDDFNEVRRLQERYNAFSFLLQMVGEAPNLLALSNRNLNDIKEIEQFNSEYALD